MKRRTLIIEDEAPAYRRLSGLLAQHHPGLEVVDVLDSIEAALDWFPANPAPELIFSDIQLSDGLSFEIYRQLPPPCPIVFTTAYDAYMLEAFRTNGIDYLLKPVEEEDLARSIAKFEALVQRSTAPALPDIERLLAAVNGTKTSYRERFLVKLGTKLLPVPTRDIAYFLSSEGTTELHTRDGKRHLLDQPLDEIEQQLDPTVFHRLNRQCIACVQCIAVVHQHFNGKLKVELKPAAPTEVMVSREKARGFKEWLDGVR
ncbi:MAG: response regulator transcription factor [Flavobacteriales bacterium]|nr:response regulator transcription factor [Flavobacteriales bacterium]